MNKLQERFHKETKNEWLPPYCDLQDQLDAEVAFSNWLAKLIGDAPTVEGRAGINVILSALNRYSNHCLEMLCYHESQTINDNSSEGEHENLKILSDRAFECQQMFIDSARNYAKTGNDGDFKIALVEF